MITKHLKHTALLFIFILVLFISIEKSWSMVYQWNDESGTIHLSNNFPDNTQEVHSVEISKPRTSVIIFANNPIKPYTSSLTAAANKNSIQNNMEYNLYKNIIIKQPKDQETLQYDDGKVNVILSLEPMIENNDTIFLYLDGNKIAETKNTYFTIQNITRGEHSLQAIIKDENNNPLLYSPTVTFYIHQSSSIISN